MQKYIIKLHLYVLNNIELFILLVIFFNQFLFLTFNLGFSINTGACVFDNLEFTERVLFLWWCIGARVW